MCYCWEADGEQQEAFKPPRLPEGESMIAAFIRWMDLFVISQASDTTPTRTVGETITEGDNVIQFMIDV